MTPPKPSSTSPLAPSLLPLVKCSMAGRCVPSKTTSTPVFPWTAPPFFSSKSKASPKPSPRGRRDHRSLQRASRPRSPPRPRQRRTRPPLERPQKRFRRSRPPGPQQLRPRRRHSPFETSASSPPHPPNRRSIRLSNRQHLPRRRRQPPPHRALRSSRQTAIRTRPPGRRRNHPLLRRSRWRAHRRTRRRHGKIRAYAAPLLRRRLRPNAPRPRRLQSRFRPQPRQNLPPKQRLRRNSHPPSILFSSERHMTILLALLLCGLCALRVLCVTAFFPLPLL